MPTTWTKTNTSRTDYYQFFGYGHPYPPDNDPGCYSEITPEEKKILIKMFVFLEKNLYLDAIGLHLK